MKSFYFAKDHILRFRCWDYNRKTKSGRYLLLPVRSLEKVEPGIFWRSLYNSIEFEDGLTVRDLFLNLEPWAEQMEQLSQMDFQAFCDECRKPAAPDEDLDHVLIRPIGRIAAIPDYERSNSRDLSWFRDRKAITTDRFHMEFRWDTITILKEPRYDSDADHTFTGVSTDMSPLSEWGHCPVKLVETMVLADDSLWGHRMGHLSTSEPLFNQGNPLVTANYHKDHLSGLSVNVEMEPNFMETLVRGVFWGWGFHYSPAQRDDARNEVIEAINELKQDLADGKDLHELGDAPSEKEERKGGMSSYDRENELQQQIYQQVIDMDPEAIVGAYEKR